MKGEIVPHIPVTTLADGVESTVYLLQIDDRQLIMKKRRNGGRQNYAFETFAYTQLEKAGGLVPKVIFADDDLILMTALPGSEMDDRPELFNQQALFVSIATDLAKCHSIQLDNFGGPRVSGATFVGQQDSWRAYLDQFTSTLQTITPISQLTQADIELLQTYWSTMLPTIRLEHGVLVHGDFAMSAIFVDGKTYIGLIDFGDALIGDPLLDLAYFRFKEITKPYGPTTYQLLRDAYKAARDLTWGADTESLILFYMIYWGIRRWQHCPDAAPWVKFCDKLHEVASLIKPV